MVPYSFVIATMEGSDDHLFQCLNSIKQHTDGSYEIVLVVNGPNPAAERIGETFDAKLVHVEEPVHFSKAYNLGLAEASGQYLVALNDDVLVTPGWNVKMMRALENFSTKTGAPRAGLVGPVSNNVGGPQMIPTQLASRISPLNYKEAAAEIEKSNEENWVGSVLLSGFCLMASRRFYDENAPEFFDERLVNGAEDGLISLQAMFQGYSNVIAGDTFVYHHGHKTMDRVAPDASRGVRNLFDYYKIAREEVLPDEEKVASACRARLLNQDHVDIFLQALDQQMQLGDEVFLVNDRSEVWPQEQIDDLSEKYGTPVQIWTYEGGHDEVRDRAKLLEMATEAGCTWFLSWDADEIFEDKFDREYLERLISVPRPDVLCFQFHWYTFWDPEGRSWRTDDTFGRMQGARLSRILPGQKIARPESGLHMGNVPNVGLAGSSRVTSVRIKHYGYQTPEERQRKYEFYEDTDEVKDPGEIGHEDYSHLIPTSYQVAEWREDNGIAIGTIVLNEEIRLYNYLDRLWPFADEMVFTDTGSEDRTVEILEFFGAKVLDYEEETGREWNPEVPDLADARNTIFSHVDSEWFWHFDIDEVLPDSPEFSALGIVRRLIDRSPADGFQAMFQNWSPSGAYGSSQATRLVRNPHEWYYTGYTHETMDKAAEGKKIDLLPFEIVHLGWLNSDEDAKKKLKIYLRGNLRMMEDYPEDPRGWFNTALHLLDIGAVNTAMKFIEQALARNPGFAAARKELLVQGAEQLSRQAQHLQRFTPPGHPLHQFAGLAIEQLKDIKADNETLLRVPEHVAEVLQEPEFEGIRELVKKFDGMEFGGGVAGTASPAEQVQSETLITQA